MVSTMEGRSLSDLKVADLRRELEKRQKDKVGVKQVLVDRLKEALEEDGHDPLTYRFGNDTEGPRNESDGVDSSACRVSLCDLVSNQSVNGEESDTALQIKDDTPFNRNDALQSDASEEQVEQKKISEEPVTYVVQVGDQEEDLDYDLKAECDEVEDPSRDNQKTTPEAVNKDVAELTESSKGNKQSIENRTNLWVSNLPKTVKAADLKQHFSKSGKVVSATVVMSTRSPGGCFGFLQMASAEDAAKAARNFDCSEYNGHKISVEATERKPPALTSKSNDRPNALRGKHANSTEVGKPRSRKRASRHARGRPRSARARAAAAKALPRRATLAQNMTEPRREPPRLTRPPPPRMNPRLLAYQSLKRASLVIAATRYGSSRSSHPRDVIPPRYSGPVRSPPQFSRQSTEFDRRYMPSDRREPRPPTPRRPGPRVDYGERRRLPSPGYEVEKPRPVPPRPMPPPRRSEPVPRVSSRPREPLPPPPMDRRRSVPDDRPFDSHSKMTRVTRSPVEIARNYGHIPSLRPESHAYDRMETSRLHTSGGRQPSPMSPFNRPTEHYRTCFEPMMQRRPSPVRDYPPRPPPTLRRDYRDISRSPPRSRNMALMRPYPDSSPQHDMGSRPMRDRSPLTYGGNNAGRQRVVDYGHRSDPRDDYPPWKSESPRIQTPGHTWKPASHSFVSNYGPRRY